MYDNQLIKAVQENNYSKVEALLGDGANANLNVCCIGRKHLSQIYCAIDDLETQERYLEQEQEDRTVFKKQSLLHSVTNAEIAKILILYGANLNAMDSDLNSPLITAVGNKQDLDIVRILLINGCRVNHINYFNQTALFFAIANDNLETVLELIKFGARVQEGLDGEYLKAVESVEVAKVLFEKGINISAPNVLHSILRNHKSFSLIKFLITHGADIHGKDEYNKPPIAYAFSHPNKMELLNELIKKRVDLDVRISGSSLMHLYCMDDVDTLRLLLQHGADVNIKDSKRNSLLHEAILLKKDFSIINTVLMFGADVDTLNNNNQTPLFIAIYDKNDDYIIDELLKHNTSVNIICRDQLAVIHMADNINLINKLLLYGGDVNCEDSKGQTPLYYAIQRRNIEIITELLKCGANVNVCDADGRTPLLHAIECMSDIEVIRELIVNGSKLDSKDNNGKTCLHYSILFTYNEEIVEELLKYELDINCKDVLKKTSLYYAVKKSRPVSIIEKLVKHGGDVHEKFDIYDDDEKFDVADNSLLHVTDRIDIFNLLLKNGLDIYSRNKKNETPLQYFIRSENLNLVELIIALLHLYIDCNGNNTHNYEIIQYLGDLEMTHEFSKTIAPNVIYYYFTCGAHYNIEIFKLLNSVMFYSKLRPLCILFKTNDRFEGGKYKFIKKEISRMKSEEITKSLILYDFLRFKIKKIYLTLIYVIVSNLNIQYKNMLKAKILVITAYN